jgi:hypothetical protein
VKSSENGYKISIIVQHFINKGYDVTINKGRNGGYALSRLLWPSHDKYILDAAVILIGAGSAITYENGDGSDGVLGDLDCKLAVSWGAFEDYEAANLFEAYYTMLLAAKDGKDYKTIRSYHDCIGLKMTKAQFIPENDMEALRKNGDITEFNGNLVLCFGDKPLLIRKYVEFLVDPLFVQDNINKCVNIENQFDKIIGSTLKDLKYIDEHCAYLCFDNGCNICFKSKENMAGNYIGTYEIGIYLHE